MPAVKVLVVISPAQSGFSSPGSLSRTISLPHSYSQIQQTELPRLCMYVIVESPLPSPKHYCALRSAFWASLMAQIVKNLTTMQEAQVRSLGQEDPLEEEMATYSSILA